MAITPPPLSASAPADADAAPLTTALKAGWGIGSLGTQTVLTVHSLLLLFFFTSVLGLQPAVAGALIFGAKLFDAVAAPAVGAISDRASGRWGRRRPFLLAGGLVCAAGLAFIFNPPSAHPAVLFVGLLVIALGYSLFNVPYLTMPAEMTRSPRERTSIMSWRIGFVGVGGIVCTAVLPLCAQALGGGRHGYGVAGVLAAVVVLAAMTTAFAATGSARATTRTAATLTGAASLRLVLTNRPFITLLMAKTLQLFGLAAVSASMLFFIKAVIGGSEGTLAVWGLANNAASIVSMPLWLKIAARLGKRNTYILSILLYCANGFTWLLAGPGEPMSLILARAIAGGLFSAGLLLMGQSILPDTIEYDHYRSGQRREGVYAGAYGFVEKASTALGPLVIGVLLQGLGFSPRAASQTHDGTLAVYLAVAVVPAGAYLVSIIPLLFYNLSEARLSALQAAGPQANAGP